MIKKTLLIFSIFVSLSFNESQRQKHSYKDNTISCSYETSQGRIDGQYVSYYKTGKKKAEGQFENNYRIGKLTVWDSTGSVRMQREYSDPFTFQRIIPEVPKGKTISLLNTTRYSIQKNKDGFIDYFDLKERMVEWSTKVWRIVLPKDNPLLFNDNNLFKVINNNILDKKIRAYDAKDDEFQQELQLPLNIETSSFKIIGLKIREDWFFDNERLVSEARVIGLCPVAINKLQGDTVDLYWVYLPDIRKYLAQAEIYQKGLSPKIRTIDDLFFYRYFWGQIYKESNVHDGSISTYNAGREIDKEAERIEMNIIEREHDIWIGFTK